MDSLKPALVEPGVKYFIGSTLKQCREFKDKNITILFNITLFIVFITILSCILIYRYKGKPTIAEIEIKNRKKQEYIISKLQKIAFIKQQNSERLITNLPSWSDHPELSNLTTVRV